MKSSASREHLAAAFQELKQRAETKLIDFVKFGWAIVEPVAPFIPGWHIDAICEHLEAMSRGQILSLIINVPPGHSKSLLTSVMWLPWWWIREPSIRSMHATYAEDLASRDSRKTLSLIQSEWYHRQWGDKYTIGKQTETRIENSVGGMRQATSVGGMGTGERVHASVSDDLIRANDSRSAAAKREAIEHLRAMVTRGIAGYPYRQLLIMQRLAEDDPTGWALSQDLGFEHLCLPAEYDPKRKCVTSIGFSDPRTEPKELLWPAAIDRQHLAKLEKGLGPYGAAGQLQQQPAPSGGGRFKEDWFRYFTIESNGFRLFKPGGTSKFVPEGDCEIFFGIMDPAGTDKEQNAKACYTVISAIAVTADWDMLIFDQYREQVETPDAAEAAVQFVRRNELEWLGVEKDGIGLGVIQTIRRRGIAVRAIKARGSKEARSETAEIRMAAGMIYFLKDAPWLAELQKELLLFPSSENKDQVDALAHAARVVHKKGGAPAGSDDAEWSTDAEARAEREVSGVTAPTAPPDIPDEAVATAPAVDDPEVAAWLAGEDE